MALQRCDEQMIGERLSEGFRGNLRDMWKTTWRFVKEHKGLFAILCAGLMLLATIIGALASPDFSLDSKNSITVIKGVKNNVYSVGISNLHNKTLTVTLYSKNNAMNPLSKTWVSFDGGKKSIPVEILPNKTDYVQFYVTIPDDIEPNSYTGQIDLQSVNQTESYVFTINYKQKSSMLDNFIFYGSIGLIIFFFLYVVKRTFFGG